MSENVITDPSQVHEAWLLDILRKSNALTTGNIKDFQVDFSTSTNSHIARIRINYTADARGERPRSLILKMCHNEDEFLKDSEVNYYARDYIHLADVPIPTCYDAQFSTKTNAYHILMENLSDTHEKDTPPSLQYGKSIAKALAKLHAYGWGKGGIKKLDGSNADAAAFGKYIDHTSQGLNGMLEAIQPNDNAVWEKIIENVFNKYPTKMLERIQNPNGFAIVHGDLNPGNILYPKTGEGKVYFLDRQPFTWSLTTWLAVSDVAYMMVPYWEIETRRELEVPILKEYHEQLIASGVQNYSWEQLLEDYKLTAMQTFFIASEWNIKATDRNRMRWLWTAELERAILAYSDLNCGELLNI